MYNSLMFYAKSLLLHIHDFVYTCKALRAFVMTYKLASVVATSINEYV